MDMDQVFIDDLADPKQSPPSRTHSSISAFPRWPQTTGPPTRQNSTTQEWATLWHFQSDAACNISKLHAVLGLRRKLRQLHDKDLQLRDDSGNRSRQQRPTPRSSPASWFLTNFDPLGSRLAAREIFCGCCRGPKSNDEILAKKLVHKRDKCKRGCCGMLLGALVVVFL